MNDSKFYLYKSMSVITTSAVINDEKPTELTPTLYLHPKVVQVIIHHKPAQLQNRKYDWIQRQVQLQDTAATSKSVLIKEAG